MYHKLAYFLVAVAGFFVFTPGGTWLLGHVGYSREARLAASCLGILGALWLLVFGAATWYGFEHAEDTTPMTPSQRRKFRAPVREADGDSLLATAPLLSHAAPVPVPCDSVQSRLTTGEDSTKVHC